MIIQKITGRYSRECLKWLPSNETRKKIKQIKSSHSTALNRSIHWSINQIGRLELTLNLKVRYLKLSKRGQLKALKGEEGSTILSIKFASCLLLTFFFFFFGYRSQFQFLASARYPIIGFCYLEIRLIQAEGAFGKIELRASRYEFPSNNRT